MKSTQKVAFLFATLACCFAFSSSVIAQDNVSSKETDFASELMSKGKYEEARKIFLDTSEKSSDKKTVDSSKIFSTLCLFYMNDKEKFINESKKILKNNSSSEHLYALKETLANAFLEKRNFDEAGVYFLAASEDPQASFDQQVNSKISVLNCLFLGGKKDEFLKNSQTFLDESKSYDSKLSDNTRAGLNNLKMTTADVFHNNGDWKKAREVYLTVSDANFGQYVSARARATQSLFYEGDYLKFEEEFGQIEKMKGDFQSFETENLLLIAAFKADTTGQYNLAIERLEKYLNTEKFSPKVDQLLARAAFGKCLLMSVQNASLSEINSYEKSETLYQRKDQGLEVLKSFLEDTLTPDKEMSKADICTVNDAVSQVYYTLQDYETLEKHAVESLKATEPYSHDWIRQMYWVGLAQVKLNHLNEAQETFRTVVFSNAKDMYQFEHGPSVAAYWLLWTSIHLKDSDTAVLASNWIKKNGLGEAKIKAQEDMPEYFQ